MVGRIVPVPREIVGWQREGEGSVVLSLVCGHARHVRHVPPLQPNPWVTRDEAVRGKVGESIECLRCGQRLLPEGAKSYRRTRSFDEHTVPAGLLGTHRTAPGVWGRLWVEQGRLWLHFDPPLSERVDVVPGEPAVIPAALSHRVRLSGPVRFSVEFLRVADSGG